MQRDMLTHLLETVLRMSATQDGGFTDAMARQVEHDFRHLYGGNEIYIQKDGKREDKRMHALEEVMRTGNPKQAADNNGISRSAMYRLLNKKRER